MNAGWSGWLLAVCATGGTASPCPTDAAPRAPGTLLVVQQGPVARLALDAAGLAALPAATLTQRQSVSAAANALGERSIRYDGALLRDVLGRAGFGGPNDRGARLSVVEAVASDGYRALYSWGELFNSPLGEQAIVITSVDGRPLDETAGPLALRSLADLRPGPRHVRNLCALLLRP